MKTLIFNFSKHDGMEIANAVCNNLETNNTVSIGQNLSQAQIQYCVDRLTKYRAERKTVLPYLI